MDNYKIDVTGDDILSKNAGIVIVYNNKFVYGFKFNSHLQNTIRNNFQKNLYCFSNKKILKPRIYCAVVTLILKKIQIDHYTDPTSFQLNICNDFDGHSNDII
ncbi:MAG: hypothetical protein ACMXYE_01240 [Candidatus Woesearchaeota archaeon]